MHMGMNPCSESFYTSRTQMIGNRNNINNWVETKAKFMKTPILLAAIEQIPLYARKVAAGFTSPAEDYVEDWRDLNQLLAQHKSSMFFLPVKGVSMINAGILNGDIIVVDCCGAIRPVCSCSRHWGWDDRQCLILINGNADIHAENHKCGTIRFR